MEDANQLGGGSTNKRERGSDGDENPEKRLRRGGCEQEEQFFKNLKAPIKAPEFQDQQFIEQFIKNLKAPIKAPEFEDLPLDVIHSLLSLLPSTFKAVKFGFVAKKWMNLNFWRGLSVLIFYAWETFHPDFSQIVGRLLSYTEEPDIWETVLEKFHLVYDLRLAFDEDLDTKINLATGRKAKEIVVYALNKDGRDYPMPQNLVNNPFLVRLDLRCCLFRPEFDVNWKNLNHLILGCHNLTFASIANAIVNSPSLKRLDLRSFNASVDGILRSDSLETLTFQDVFQLGADPSFIRIQCPKLENLNALQLANGWDGGMGGWLWLPSRTVESVFSGSPMLSNLSLGRFSHGELSISSTSLKKLVLMHIQEAGVFEILCPKLELLILHDFRFARLRIMRLDCDIVNLDAAAGDENLIDEILQLQISAEIDLMPNEGVQGLINGIRVTFSCY